MRTIAAVVVVAFLLMLSFDMNISTFFHSMKDTYFVSFFRLLTNLGLSKPWFIASALLFIFFWMNDDKPNRFKAGLFFISIALSGIIVNLIKPIFGRARPESFFERGQHGFYFFESSYALVSFPSGHSATAMGVGVMLALYFPKYRWLFLGFFALVAFSRVVVLAHFTSDVLIGGLIGGLVSYVLYAKFIQKRIGWYFSSF